MQSCKGYSCKGAYPRHWYLTLNGLKCSDWKPPDVCDGGGMVMEDGGPDGGGPR